jgi:hypothetical protein
MCSVLVNVQNVWTVSQNDYRRSTVCPPPNSTLMLQVDDDIACTNKPPNPLSHHESDSSSVVVVVNATTAFTAADNAGIVVGSIVLVASFWHSDCHWGDMHNTGGGSDCTTTISKFTLDARGRAIVVN